MGLGLSARDAAGRAAQIAAGSAPALTPVPIVSPMKSVLVLKAAATNSRAYIDATLGVRRAIRELNKLGSSFEGPAEDAPSEWTRVLSWSDAAHGARVRFFSDLEND
jgi:hypothetical protein